MAEYDIFTMLLSFVITVVFFFPWFQIISKNGSVLKQKNEYVNTYFFRQFFYFESVKFLSDRQNSMIEPI